MKYRVTILFFKLYRKKLIRMTSLRMTVIL